MVDVLMVEDEPAILESLHFILTRDGWSVDAVRDGEAAIQAVWRLKPRMVLLDIMLPKMGGLDVLKTIRSQSATAKIPVVVLTARGQQYDRQLAIELKADGFITKPYANSDVIAEVRRMLVVNHA
ncbi:two-component system response regulator [Falsochrobactrum shanghaiense]|uniref:Polar-differentiation response regulator DivK n=1 Tax=Falsochrobactrum shanghaiense TaxID=2201899 RepID=A0A316JAB9_9HYPH|nr:response regulator [Falsochrobactrum shanghaiense]PWL18286.1 two-component system response regulator [Falsochrobactrum shanghaiense]